MAEPAEAKHWTSINRRLLYIALGCTGLATVAILMSAVNLLTAGSKDNSPVTRDGYLAGVMVTGVAMMYHCLAVNFERKDSGLPIEGLRRLLMTSTIYAIVIQLVFMLVWPLAVDTKTFGEPLAAVYLADPYGFVVTALFVVTAFFWQSLSLVGLSSRKTLGLILGFVYLFAIAGLTTWQGVVNFSAPAEQANLDLWLILAVLGVALQPVAGILVKRNIERHRLDPF